MKKLFPRNEHTADRALRIALGLSLIGLAAAGTVGAWGYAGALPLLTGLLGSCPAYTLFGYSTCPKKAA
jgi:hypothetical protein